MRKISLRGRLLLIASTAILPLAVVCGLSLHALFKAQYQQTQASTLGLARALATTVDGELRLTIAALQALALTEPLGATDDAGLAAARALASAVRGSHAEWRGLLLADPTGKVVFNTEGSASGARNEVIERASLAEVLRTGKPMVGSLTAGPHGNFAFPVRVPVLRGGAVRYVLTAIVRPEAIGAVLSRQRVPEGWAVSIFDADNARIARTVDDDLRRGQPPSETLQALLRTMNGRSEIFGIATNVDGVRVQTAVTHVDTGRWTLALGAPVSTAENAWRHTMAAYGAGLLISLALGGLAAWWMSRAITRPMARLRADADALGRGVPPAPRPSGVAEVDAVADALASAAAQRTRSEAERERLLAAERSARSTTQEAERRLERLVSVSALLSRSLEESSTLAAIAGVIVPDVADLCRIDLLDETGQLQRKLTHHFDPVRSAEIARFVSTRSTPADVPGSFPWAIATGKTFLHNIDDPEVPTISNPQLREFVLRLGISAGCVVPLVARGRTIGAMAVLQAESGRRFTADDGVLIGELAQRAALALDNVRLLADARVAQAQAEAANQAKDEFLAMLGHELRNPLAPIALSLQLMARRDAQAFPRERQIIERQVKHLSRMVDDLLDVSRIVSGKIALKLESVDLREVVTRALELTLPALQQRKAMPELALPDRPVRVQGDALRLVQIVCNLLNNSAKFSGADAAIRVTLEARGDDAELTVSDEGIGISPALLPHVFERFVQGEQALQRASGGLGLGLAIAQNLAQLHGGSITAFSAGLGLGSAFTVRLPLAAQAQDDERRSDDAAEPVRRLRLLLVDDNRDAVDSLAACFELEGHEVRTAGSAEEAIERLAQAPADGAVFDIGLPGMDGYALARHVRADSGARTMALIALTGYGRAIDRQHALAAGFDDHFAKPAQPERMLERLQQLLRRDTTPPSGA